MSEATALPTEPVSLVLSLPRNPLKLCFIDFGLGFADGSAEAKGVDLYVLERALVRFVLSFLDPTLAIFKFGDRSHLLIS